VLPSPLQHFAHVAFGAPAPPRDFTLHAPAVATSRTHRHPELSTPAPATRQPASSGQVSDKTHPGQLHSSHLRQANGAWAGYPTCVLTQPTKQNPGRAVGHSQDPVLPSPAPNPDRSGPGQGPGGSGPARNTASPGPSLPDWLGLPTTACPSGTVPAKAAHARGQ
jgi:hypothetical protein